MECPVPMPSGEDLAAKIDGLMPDLTGDLARLAEIPPVPFPGSVREEVLRAHDLLVELMRGAGVREIRDLTLPDTNPVVTGTIPPPAPEAPTVLLYAHYDVRPPGGEPLGEVPPPRPGSGPGPARCGGTRRGATRADGAIRGRAVADGKSNLLVHLGALRAFDGRPPVGVRIVFEGQDDYCSIFDYEHPSPEPEDFARDAMVVTGMDDVHVHPGMDALSIVLCGAADVMVEVRALGSAGHGGVSPSELRGAVLAEARFFLRHAAEALSGPAHRCRPAHQPVNSNSVTSWTGR
jgi:acetylornithine deacetylase/succinyl-diaminopimelate desuccinylase-like protein